MWDGRGWSLPGCRTLFGPFAILASLDAMNDALGGEAGVPQAGSTGDGTLERHGTEEGPDSQTPTPTHIYLDTQDRQ